MKIQVCRVEETNPIIPVILMDKKTRQAVGSEPSDLVFVRNGKMAVICVVGPAYSDDVGKGIALDAATAHAMNVGVGSVVDVWMGQSHRANPQFN